MLEPWNDLPLPDLYRRLAGGGLVGRLLELARDEDLGPAGVDLTGMACETGDRAEARVVARNPGVIAGLATIPGLLDAFGVDVETETVRRDGERVGPGDAVITLRGPLAELVKIERTLLNLLGRLSGVATRTGRFVGAMHAAGDHRAALYDTRKTTPGLRVLEKYAVRCGGGRCHRLGLHDAVMFKDNHIAGVPTRDLAAHMTGLVERVRASRHAPVFIEAEVDTLEQLDALLTLAPGVIDVVLLDNMGPELLGRAVSRRDAAGSPVLLEASGGVTLETIGAIASTGVDRISVGSLTHHAASLDLGLDIG